MKLFKKIKIWDEETNTQYEIYKTTTLGNLISFVLAVIVVFYLLKNI